MTNATSDGSEFTKGLRVVTPAGVVNGLLLGAWRLTRRVRAGHSGLIPGFETQNGSIYKPAQRRPVVCRCHIAQRLVMPPGVVLATKASRAARLEGISYWTCLISTSWSLNQGNTYPGPPPCSRFEWTIPHCRTKRKCLPCSSFAPAELRVDPGL